MVFFFLIFSPPPHLRNIQRKRDHFSKHDLYLASFPVPPPSHPPLFPLSRGLEQRKTCMFFQYSGPPPALGSAPSIVLLEGGNATSNGRRLRAPLFPPLFFFFRLFFPPAQDRAPMNHLALRFPARLRAPPYASRGPAAKALFPPILKPDVVGPLNDVSSPKSAHGQPAFSSPLIKAAPGKL